jgi:hypothetical protein
LGRLSVFLSRDDVLSSEVSCLRGEVHRSVLGTEDRSASDVRDPNETLATSLCARP